MTEIEQVDVELCLLGGKPVDVNGFDIYPITFNEISDKDIGFSKYNRAVGTFCISVNKLDQILSEHLEEKYLYDFLCLYSVENLDIRNDILLALILSTKQAVTFDKISRTYKINDCSLDSDTFLKIQKIVRIRNGLENIEEEMENPANEMARRLLKQRKENREKLSRLKSGSSNNITIVDLISVCASGLHLALPVVYSYDVYQLNDQINRLKIFKDYDISIQALLHGANSKEMDIKFWICSNKDKEDIDSSDSDSYQF